MGCSVVKPDNYAKLSHLERAAHTSLNALCEEHAKIILSPQGQNFDNEKFDSSEKGCGYLKGLVRNIQVTLHPDKNPVLKNLAVRAFIEAQAASQTLAKLHLPQACQLK